MYRAWKSENEWTVIITKSQYSYGNECISRALSHAAGGQVKQSLNFSLQETWKFQLTAGMFTESIELYICLVLYWRERWSNMWLINVLNQMPGRVHLLYTPPLAFLNWEGIPEVPSHVIYSREIAMSPKTKLKAQDVKMNSFLSILRGLFQSQAALL